MFISTSVLISVLRKEFHKLKNVNYVIRLQAGCAHTNVMTYTNNVFLCQQLSSTDVSNVFSIILSHQFLTFPQNIFLYVFSMTFLVSLNILLGHESDHDNKNKG